jgi:hypothetical protein
LKTINVQDAGLSKLTKSYSSGNAKKLLAAPLDRVQLAKAGCRTSGSTSSRWKCSWARGKTPARKRNHRGDAAGTRSEGSRTLSSASLW